jgi:uncharacterized protein with NAD-binding domain and iron-sulfur cluster
MRLLESVLAKLPKTNKPRRRFIIALLELVLMVPGPITFRNLSRYSGYHEKTVARGFARAVDWVALNREAIAQVVPPEHEQALVLDASFIAKSGRQTYGLDRFWNGTAGRAEKGLEISALAWLDITANQAYSLSVEQTPAAVKGSNNAAVDDSRLDAYLSQLRRVVERHELQRLKYVITDGYYSKVKFLDGVIKLGLQQIGKLRGDADMRYLYRGPKRPGAGRQKQFDGKVDWSDLTRFARIDTDQNGVVVYQQLLNHKRFKRTLNIVVVVDTRGKTPRQAILFSTDLTLPALTLFRYYRARFQIEFLFRDAKQFTGLSDCQARDKDKLHCHFNASLSAVTLAKLETQQQAGGTLTEPFSMASLQRRAFNRHLLDQILAHLEVSAELTKFSPAYETLCNYGIISPQAA